MSHSSEEKVQCACGEEFEAVLWSSVNAQDEPTLRDEILAGQLNVARCPLCKQFLYAERFVLYHDPSAELMAFVFPKEYEKERAVWAEKTAADFRTAQDNLEAGKRLPYEPITVFGLDGLVDALHWEDEQTDEGDILASMASSLPVDVRRLRPSVARLRGLPTRLPFGRDKKQSGGDRLLDGLRAVLAANDRLAVYAALLERVAKSPIDPSALFE